MADSSEHLGLSGSKYKEAVQGQDDQDQVGQRLLSQSDQTQQEQQGGSKCTTTTPSIPHTSVTIKPAAEMSPFYRQQSSHSDHGSAKYRKPSSCRRGRQTLVFVFCSLLVVFLLVVVFFMMTIRQSDDDDDKRSKLADRGLVEAEAACGIVQGLVEDGGYAFRGIPYAVPPVGHLRWKKTVPLDKMEDCWSGAYLAHESKPLCYQKPIPGMKRETIEMSEDCLYLDVYTEHVTYTDPMPVVVYFPSDSFFGHDSVSIKLHPSARLAADSKVVFVSVQFRLGAFGFMALRALRHGYRSQSSGNYGLHDMIAALKWVQVNIDGFGGNPRDVTVLGHGSSATAILGLISAPITKGLFNRAWIVGGASDFVNVTLDNAEQENKEFLKKAKCRDLKCLSGVEPNVILDSVVWKKTYLDLPYSDEKVDAIAVIDGELLTDLPSSSIHDGHFNGVSLVIGVSPFDPWNIRAVDLNSTLLTERITSMLKTFSDDLARSAIQVYSEGDNGISPVNFVRMVNDQRLVCPAMQLAQTVDKAIVNDVIVYAVSYIPSDGILTKTTTTSSSSSSSSSSHRLDIAAIFDQLPSLLQKPTRRDVTFGQTMRGIFFSFLRGTLDTRVSPPGYLDVTGDEVEQRKRPYPNCAFWEKSGLYPKYAIRN